MRIALIFDKTRPDTTGIYLERACQRLHMAYDHWWLRDASDIPTGYDLFLRIDHGNDYHVQLPDRLRPAVFYAIDTHLPHSWKKIRHLASRYDLVFCCHRDALTQLPGAEWLPVACDPDLHGADGTSRDWDIAFVGTDGGVPRKFYLQILRERYRNSFIGNAEHTQLRSIYGRARIGFNYSIANDVNMRVFEVIAAGALLITNRLDNDDLMRLGLEHGRHFVAYRSPQELFESIQYFLAHLELAQEIARAGNDLVRMRHTYTNRMQQLLLSVSRRLGVPTT